MVCSDGESNISRYAGLGRQLLPDKPLKDIFKNAVRQRFIFGKTTFYFWYAVNQNNHEDG